MSSFGGEFDMRRKRQEQLFESLPLYMELRLRRRADAEMGGRRAQMAAAQRTHEEKLSSQRREMTSEVEKLVR